jgi:hypothetical protein
LSAISFLSSVAIQTLNKIALVEQMPIAKKCLSSNCVFYGVGVGVHARS